MLDSFISFYHDISSVSRKFRNVIQYSYSFPISEKFSCEHSIEIDSFHCFCVITPLFFFVNIVDYLQQLFHQSAFLEWRLDWTMFLSKFYIHECFSTEVQNWTYIFPSGKTNLQDKSLYPWLEQQPRSNSILWARH